MYNIKTNIPEFDEENINLVKAADDRDWETKEDLFD